MAWATCLGVTSFFTDAAGFVATGSDE